MRLEIHIVTMHSSRKRPFLKNEATGSGAIYRTASHRIDSNGRLTHDEFQIVKRRNTERIAEILRKSGCPSWIYEIAKSIEKGDGMTVGLLDGFNALCLLKNKSKDWIYGLKSNAEMCFIIIESLKPFATKRCEKGINRLFNSVHEEEIKKLLKIAISFNCCLDTLSIIDNLWLNSSCHISSHVDLQKVKEFHQEILFENGQEIDNLMIGTHVVQTGIPRHIDIFLENNPEALDSLLAQSCTRLKLLRYACLSTSPVVDLLTKIETDKLTSLKQWYEELAMVHSAVPSSRSFVTSQPTKQKFHTIMAHIGRTNWINYI